MSVTKKHLTSYDVVSPDDGVYAQQVNYGQSSLRSVSDVVVRHFEDYNKLFCEDKIYSGFICSNTSGMSVDVSIGVATVKGIWVSSDGVVTVTIPTTDDTYYVVLRRGDDGGDYETRNPLNDTISLTYTTDASFSSSTDLPLAKVVVSGGVITSFTDFGSEFTRSVDRIIPRNGSTVKVYTGAFPDNTTKAVEFVGTYVYNQKDSGGYWGGYDLDYRLYHLSGTGNVIDNYNNQNFVIAFSGNIGSKYTTTGEVVSDGYRYGSTSDPDLITALPNILLLSGSIELEDDRYIGVESDNTLIKLSSGTVVMSGTINMGVFAISGSGYSLSNTDMTHLDTIAGLSKTDGNFVVADGTSFTVESGQTALTSLGFGTITNTPDIDQSLLTTSSVSFNDISGSTLWSGSVIQDAYIANDITLDNITQITARDHSDLQNAGSYTHAQIDSHISATSGVHGLGDITNTPSIDQSLLTTSDVTFNTVTEGGTSLSSKYHPLTTVGISNSNLVQIDHATVVSGDYAKFTSSGVEGRSVTEVRSDLSISNVEDTAVSTWAGSTNLTTLGTVSTGTWQGTAIDDAYISSASTWNSKLGDTEGVIEDTSGTFSSTSISVSVPTTLTTADGVGSSIVTAETYKLVNVTTDVSFNISITGGGTQTFDVELMVSVNGSVSYTTVDSVTGKLSSSADFTLTHDISVDGLDISDESKTIYYRLRATTTDAGLFPDVITVTGSQNGTDNYKMWKAVKKIGDISYRY